MKTNRKPVAKKPAKGKKQPEVKKQPDDKVKAAAAPKSVAAQAALAHVTRGDLRAATRALRRGVTAKRELSETEREALEDIARKLLKLLSRDRPAAQMREARELQSLVKLWLKRPVGRAFVRGIRAPAPGRVGGDKRAAKVAARVKPVPAIRTPTQERQGDAALGSIRFARPTDTPQPRVEGQRRGGRRPAEAPIATRAPGPPEATAKPSPPVVRRTPHMDISQYNLRPGMTFEVSVYVDSQEARPGETSAAMVVEAEAIVEIQLVVSEHFSVNGPAVTRMTITDAERSDAEGRFTVRVRPASELPADVVPSLIALFFYKGRPSGNVTRTVEIAGVATRAFEMRRERIQAEDGAPADLTVVVTGAVINDGRQFFCTVRSPWLEKYKIGDTEAWNLPQTAEEIVLSYMERFTADAITPSMLLAELRGAGRRLFDAAPKLFHQAFWDLIDTGVPLRTIAIVTQEPFIPWELMIPYRMKEGRRQQREALGTEFLVGRWPSPDGVSPTQRINLIDSFVIAPAYTPPLSFAQAEAAIVADSFQGEIIAPADFDGIALKLGREGKTLIHIVCHGEDEETQADVIRSTNPDRRVRNRVQIIRLEKGQTLNSTQILGIGGLEAVFQEKHPLVFMNACEIGRTTPALVGVGGFPKSFVDLGASAVIAPLWGVKDRFAHEVAKTFYERLKTARGTPFAEILRDLRRKAYEPGHAEDTFAAYCFYGDPAASQ